MEIKIVSSADGSDTLFVPSLNETYHSLKGALTESEHVFIKEGLDYVAGENNNVAILEVGFGTGLNAILSLKKAEESGLALTYHTLEPFPLSSEILAKLNYRKLISDAYSGKLDEMYSQEWEVENELLKNFKFKKIKKRLEDFQTDINYEVIYFDAFAPNKQPEVWGEENLKKCYSVLAPGGVLVTYCAQGQFKRNLKACGFEVQTIPGPPGKKEMTRGLKK